MHDVSDTPRDLALAQLADAQHGIVAARQLAAIGLDKDAVARRAHVGRLRPIHRAVYAVGHTSLTVPGRYLAAVLACGDGAVLSHHSAASLWDLRQSAHARIDVTVPFTSGYRTTKAIAVHRSRRPVESTVRDGIPVTTVARTLADLADTLRDRQLEKAVEQAVLTGRLDLREVAAVARTAPGRRGPARLLRLLGSHDAEATFTRSSLEDAVLELCDEYGITRPLTNVVVAGYEVDCVWPDARLIVEADSWRHHSSRVAFERDRRRDAHLAALGWRVVRLTYDRVTTERAGVAALLLRLGASATPPRPRPRGPAAASRAPRR